MGLAFKPNIDDLRESPAMEIAGMVADSVSDNSLLIVEPNISEHGRFKLTDYKTAYENADIVAFLVNHREFATLDYRQNVVVMDFCGVFKLPYTAD